MVFVEKLFGTDAGILRSRQFRLLLLANVNAALGTVLVSPLLESLTGPFAVSEARIGLLITAFTAPPVVGIPVVGMVSDRYGRQPVLAAGLALFGLSGAAVGLAESFETALALRMLQGVGYAGITPVIITAIGDLYTDSTEATAQGLRFTSSGVAQATFPLLAGFLVAIAWQYPFALYFLAVPTAILVALFFEEPSASTSDSNGDGREVGTAPDGGAKSTRSEYVKGMSRLVVQPKIAAILVAFAVPSFLYVAFITYNSFLVVRILDTTPGVAGVIITVMSIVYAVAASQAGRITEYFGSRVRPLLVANLLMGVGLSISALSTGVDIAILGIGIMGLGIGLSLSLLRSVLTGLAPEHFRGGLVGVGEAVIRLANSLAPVLMGSLVAGFALSIGSNRAIRYSLLAVGVGGALLGVIAILVASAARPVDQR